MGAAARRSRVPIHHNTLASAAPETRPRTTHVAGRTRADVASPTADVASASRIFDFDARVGRYRWRRCRGVLLQTSLEQQANPRRRVGRKRPPVWLAAKNGGDGVRQVFAGKRPLAGQHLVEHAPERPDVAALVGGPTPRLLWAHVGRGAEDHAGLVISAGDVIVGEIADRRSRSPSPIRARSPWPDRSRAPSRCRP